MDAVKQSSIFTIPPLLHRGNRFSKNPAARLLKSRCPVQKWLTEYAAKTKGEFLFEYTPESFTGTELDFAVEICNAVLDVWKPQKEHPVIINLASTVSLSMPHVYANQIEYMSDHLNYRENVILSLHPHNDRSSAVAEAELGILAGGQRVEGTLFGNGERTGNVDLITLALNLFSHGVDPILDLSNIPQVVEMYEDATGMNLPPRQPYGGQLVFAAFPALIRMQSPRECSGARPFWRSLECSLSPDRPAGYRTKYENDVIHINSQSGKGGIGYLLEHKYGINMPKPMREEFGYIIKGISDHQHKELSPEEVHQIFMDTYLNLQTPIRLDDFYFVHKKEYPVHCFPDRRKRRNGTDRTRKRSIRRSEQCFASWTQYPLS